MNTLTPGSALSRLGKFESRLKSSESGGVAGRINQLGINMVDLMMWLVIAALLLAAALQGIGFYQRAAWNYQLNSDASSVRTFMEAQYTLNNNTYPTLAQVTASTDLKLTSSNGGTNAVIGVTNPTTGGWTATVCSFAMNKANVTNDSLTIYSDGTKPLPVSGTC